MRLLELRLQMLELLAVLDVLALEGLELGAAVGLLYLRDGGRTLAGWLQARRLAGAAP